MGPLIKKEMVRTGEKIKGISKVPKKKKKDSKREEDSRIHF